MSSPVRVTRFRSVLCSTRLAGAVAVAAGVALIALS